MKLATITAAGLLIAAAGALSPARADTATATCEVRNDGKVDKRASGRCEFSQRQGYVDIKLASGFTQELSPSDKPNHYKDQKGHKVERVMSGQTQIYKWHDYEVRVSFDGGAGAGAGSGGAAVGGGQVGDTPSDLADLVGSAKVGGEVDDELTKRGWTQAKADIQGDGLYAYWSKGSRCVVVHMDAARKVQSIVVGMESSCKK